LAQRGKDRPGEKESPGQKKRQEKEPAEEEGKPFFATGEIVGSYRLLYTYWRHAGDKAEESILREADFQKLQHLISQGYTRLDQLMEKLRDHFRERIDTEAARKAAKEYYGVEMGPEEAVARVADQLAGWLIEAASQWGIVRIRKGWRKEESEETQSSGET
jgi:hypothetical protein